MMKRWLAGAMVLGLMTAGGTALAAGHHGRGATASNWTNTSSTTAVSTVQTLAYHRNCTNYVDANGDGVCDTLGSCAGYVDANGDGICDNRGACVNFVDANNDGVCDTCGQGYGIGQGWNATVTGSTSTAGSNSSASAGSSVGSGYGMGYGAGYGHGCRGRHCGY